MPWKTTVHITSFEDRCAAQAAAKLEAAQRLPPGPERDKLLRDAGQLSTISHMEGWLRSSELKPPT